MHQRVVGVRALGVRQAKTTLSAMSTASDKLATHEPLWHRHRAASPQRHMSVAPQAEDP